MWRGGFSILTYLFVDIFESSGNRIHNVMQDVLRDPSLTELTVVIATKSNISSTESKKIKNGQVDNKEGHA